MSFIYAEKNRLVCNSEIIQTLSIYSDTKVSFNDNFSNWSKPTRRYLEQYGIVKSLILHSTCCISFAGNNILYVGKLLDDLAKQKDFTANYLCKKAFEIHKEAPINDIEFIICYIENTEQHIVCIKNGKMHIDCINAWIGSSETFIEMQKIRMNMLENQSNDMFKGTSDLFRKAIQETKDDSVGKDIFIHTYATSQTNRFVYSYRLESFLDIKQLVPSGKNILLLGSAAEGGFTIEYLETIEDVRINIHQADLSILYTKKYRVEQADAKNTNLRHFLLPVPYRTSTGEIIIETT